MAAILTCRGTVYPWQCDHMGHVNVMWYVGKFDEATWNAFNAVGMTPSYLRDGKHGMSAVQQNITYRRELLPGDVIEIRTTMLEVRDKVVRFLHEMRNGEVDAVAAEAELTCVHIDRRLRKATPFPDDIRARIAAAIAPDPRKE
jgi:acyl-CoA thioester hydrolase